MSESMDIPLHFQRFNKNAKRSDKTKWWKHLDHLVSSQESNESHTEICCDDKQTLTGIIHAFQELSRIKKPHTLTNSGRAVTLYQCLFNIGITEHCKKKNGVSVFIKALKSASNTFRKNEECMEILVQWTEDWMEKDSDHDIVLMPYLSSIGMLLMDTALNEDFPFVLERRSASVSEDLLNNMTLSDLKGLFDSGTLRGIGEKITLCGDWSLQNILFRWMSAYYNNFKLCLSDDEDMIKSKRSQRKTLKQVETEFYTGLFHGITSVERADSANDLLVIKNRIKDQVNESLFYLTQNRYNDTFGLKQQIVSDILLEHNDVIYPYNTVWTLDITSAWIYQQHNTEHYDGEFKLHLGTKLLYIEYDQDKQLSVLWNGIIKFESDENTLLCWIYFADFKTNKGSLYDGDCDDIEYIKFRSNNAQQFDILTQDIANNLPPKAMINMIPKEKKKKKTKKETNINKRKRRIPRKPEAAKIEMDQDYESEKEEEIPQKHHIVTSDDCVMEKARSCDIDLTDVDPECGDYIRFRTKDTAQNQHKWKYAQIILKNGKEVDVKVLGAHVSVLVNINDVEWDIVSADEIDRIWREKQEEKKENENEATTEKTKIENEQHNEQHNEKEDENRMQMDDQEIVETDDEMKRDQHKHQDNQDIDTSTKVHNDGNDQDEGEGSVTEELLEAMEHGVDAQKKDMRCDMDMDVDEMNIDKDEDDGDDNDILNDENKNENTEKRNIILVSDDGEPQQHQNKDENQDMASRPLQHLISGKIAQTQRPVSMVRSPKRSKRTATKKTPTPKWRKRAPLRLQNARNKNRKQNDNQDDKDLEKEDLIQNSADIEHIATPETLNRNNENEDEINNENIKNVIHSTKKTKATNIAQKPLQAITDNGGNKHNGMAPYDRFHNSKKRKQYDDEDDLNEYEVYIPATKKRKTVIMEEKQTQTEGAPRIDIKKIETKISSRFKILFETLFEDKLEELKNDNDKYRQFLREKVLELNETQNEYGLKMKQIQNEIFNKVRKDVFKKWKDDVMDVCEQLDEHATNIQSQNDDAMRNRNIVGNIQRSNSADDIVHQISSLLNNYNQN